MEKPMTEKESLELIATMIRRAKDSYYDTGISAMMWGIVITICSLVKLAEIHFQFNLPVDIYWLTVVAVIPQIFISIRESRNRVVKTYDDDYIGYTWMAFGISIFLMIVITNVMGSSIKSGFFEYIASLYLLLYGIPTFVTGAACKFKPMLWGGLICWASCLITLFTNIKIDLLLIAFSAIVAWFIPGIIMQKEYQKAKKELTAANV